MDKATEEVKRIAANAIIKNWRTTTYEGRAFFPSAYNWMVLFEDGIQHMTGGLTVENLTRAYLKLSRTYDFTKDARPAKPPAEPAEGAPAPREAHAVQTPAESAVSEYDESKDPNFPQRGPHEPGHIFQGRINFYRESRLKRIWLEKENERLRNAPHHADTLRRTRGEQTMIEAQKDWYTAKRAAQTFGKK